MAAKIGTSNVLFRVGSGSPSKVFLGTAAVQTVPGKPVVTSSSVSGNGLASAVVMDVTPNGGSPITRYRLTLSGFGQINSFSISESESSVAAAFIGNQTGRTATIQAENAIGVSESSESFVFP
jgi:hypothetical protein